jgi:CheY-like chemotaxis protein
MSRLVLVVDDNEALTESLTDVLELEGVRVLTAANGREALSLLRSLERLPDCILLDLRMPVMGGEQFRAAQLQDARLRSVPVVLMSADAGAGKTAASLGLACLKKPVDIGTLLCAVGRLASAA